jgi:cation diffusion facilitator CzcD-associated flavoprotein CzcO
VSVASDIQKSEQENSVAQYDVVVVGAGPYGLTAAAHLKGQGLRVASFGRPLELWLKHMPRGMNLRSHWWATNLSDPGKKYSFDRFFKLKGYKKVHPLPASIFIEYALWFQQQAVPEVDETYVSSIERENGHFTLTLEDGRIVNATAVVMAIGLYYYANRPAEFANFSPDLVSHSFEHGGDFGKFKGQTIVVVGGGQSAVENSALLHEGGANVHLVVRRSISWLEPDRSAERSLIEKLRAPEAGIAPGWKNWILEYLPYLFYRFPQVRKDRYLKNNYAAAASDWLLGRVPGKVHLHEHQKIEKIEEKDGGAEVTLSDGQKIQADHIMLATGYQVNLERLNMLASSLRAQIQADNNIPILNPWFESSVPGLYFIGLSSIRAFGPLYRFVVGTRAASQRVAAGVARYVARRK